MSNGALPCEKLDQEFHVCFVTTSPSASPLEIMQGVHKAIEKAFDEPIASWDCKSKKEVLLQPFGLFFAGNNPMHVELSSSAGLNSNYFCQTCKVGGTWKHKQTYTGFSQILVEGAPHNSSETTKHVLQQLMTALKPNVTTTLNNTISGSGIKDIDVLTNLTEELKRIHALIHASSNGAVMNPLLHMPGIDIHKDTPTEILHTILLGIKEKKIVLFQTHLGSVATAGLNIHSVQVEYICHYKGGLISKHFKMLTQVMSFLIFNLVPCDILQAWLIIGRLIVLAWCTDIEDIEAYMSKLSTCIQDFLHMTCKCSPSILILKLKFHFLCYESFNAVFYFSSIYSNHLTPSHDIAWLFTSMDSVKHVVTGGFWSDEQTGQWLWASLNILNHILHHPYHTALVGLPTERSRCPGYHLFSEPPT
ncbi:hypothetical protein V8B97DRAFT_2025393 [Scleroderma yunnanense]